MNPRALAIEAHESLLNGSGKLGYFKRRGLSKHVVEGAYVGFRNGAFTYLPVLVGMAGSWQFIARARAGMGLANVGNGERVTRTICRREATVGNPTVR
jgi:hypothetical protein